MTAIIYERLVADFENDLLNTLRSHGASQDYLETWVPDADPVKSILNMAEAAETAGASELSVAVTLGTLPAARHAELSGLLTALGTTTLDLVGETATITVSYRRQAGEAMETPRVAGRSDPGPGRISAGKSVSGDNVARPKVTVRDILARTPVEPEFEGELPAAGDGLSSVTVSEDGLVFAVSIEAAGDHLIRAARHNGATDPVERALFDTMCREMIDTPFQEAADHAAILALRRLRAGAVVAAGIMTPMSADPAFARPTRLVRMALASYKAKNGLSGSENFYEPAPQPGWLTLDDHGRAEALQRGIAGFLAERNKTGDAIALVRLEANLLGYPVRAVVTFAPTEPSPAKPDLIRALEAFLKRTVEPRLQLLHEPLKDQSALRRL